MLLYFEARQVQATKKKHFHALAFSIFSTSTAHEEDCMLYFNGLA